MIQALASRPWLAATLSGLLYVLAFPVQLGEGVTAPPGMQGLTAWVAFVPLLLALEGRAPRLAARLTWWMGTLAHMGSLFWVVVAMTRYGELPLPLALLALLLLAGFLSLQHALAGGWAAHLALKHRAPLALTFPLLWTGMEFVRNYAFSGFPWSNIAYSQTRMLPVIQIADLTGLYGITLLVLLVNGGLADALARRSLAEGAHSRLLRGAAAAVLLTLTYGAVRPWQLSQEGGPSIQVGILQGNIPQDAKWDRAWVDTIISTYRSQGAQAERQGAQLVVWPEASLPVVQPVGLEHMNEVYFTTAQGSAHHLIGAPARKVEEDGRRTLRNSAYLVAPDRSVVGRYDKTHLVPFGEYVPLKTILFFVEKLVEAIGDFVPGESREPLSDGQFRYGVLICYEDIFPEISRDFARAGAQLLVNLTNDAWYGWSSAPAQHRDMAVLRAVETRLPVVRAANTGISAFIEPTGRVLRETALFTPAVEVVTMSPREASGLYVRIGDLFSLALWALIAAASLARPRAA